MIKNIDISEDSGKIKVLIELEEFCRRRGNPKFGLDIKKVERILTEKKIKFGNLLSGPKTLRNWSSDKISGIWIFEKKITTRPARVTKKTSAKKKITGE